MAEDRIGFEGAHARAGGAVDAGQGLPPHPAIARASAVFVAAFVREVARISGGNFVDAVIRMAIVDANTRHIVADETLNRRFATFEQAVPDDLRRPVSVQGLAASLSLPFETVRRRVRALSRRDLCRVEGRSVLVTERQLKEEAVRALSDRIYGLVCELCDQVGPHAPGLLSGPSGVALVGSAPPERLVSRAAITYVLRYLEFAEKVAGNFLDGVILLSIIAANVEDHIRAEARVVLADESRRKIRVHALALAMGLAPETVRRRVNALTARGLCVRDAKGIFVPKHVIESPPIRAALDRNRANLLRLLVDLDRAGFRRPPSGPAR